MNLVKQRLRDAGLPSQLPARIIPQGVPGSRFLPTYRRDILILAIYYLTLSHSVPIPGIRPTPGGES